MLHFEAGRYILSVLITEMAGSEHSIDVEVSSDDGCTRFARSQIPVAEIRATGGRVGVFEVQPPRTNVALTIILHGPEGAFRGIDIVAEDWPFQTAEFVIFGRRLRRNALVPGCLYGTDQETEKSGAGAGRSVPTFHEAPSGTKLPSNEGIKIGSARTIVTCVSE